MSGGPFKKISQFLKKAKPKLGIREGVRFKSRYDHVRVPQRQRQTMERRQRQAYDDDDDEEDYYSDEDDEVASAKKQLREETKVKTIHTRMHIYTRGHSHTTHAHVHTCTHVHAQ